VCQIWQGRRSRKDTYWMSISVLEHKMLSIESQAVVARARRGPADQFEASGRSSG